MNRKPVKGDTVEARARQWFLEAIDFPPSPGTPLVAWVPGMMAMFAEAEVSALVAEVTKLRDSDAANLRTIQDARKALGLPPVGCQPGDKVDAGLVAEIAKLKDEDTKVLRSENLAAALLEIVELREGKAKTIRKAWYASGAWTVGGMRGFTQCHPDLQEYIEQELG